MMACWVGLEFFGKYVHLVIKYFRFAGFGLWDKRLIQDIKNVLADLLEFGLDLLTVIADCYHVLI